MHPEMSMSKILLIGVYGTSKLPKFYRNEFKPYLIVILLQRKVHLNTSNKAAAAAKTSAGPTGLFHHAAASSMAVKDHQVLINLYSGS